MPKQKHWIREQTLLDLDGQPFKLQVDGQIQDMTLAQLLRQTVRVLPVKQIQDSETGREILKACKAALSGQNHIELEQDEYDWLIDRLAQVGWGVELDGAVRDALKDELRPEERSKET